MARVLVQADDFSGAAEVGQQFAAQGLTARITLTGAARRRDSLTGDAQVLVLDTHSRAMSAAAAAAAVTACLPETGAESGVVVFKKTDSLWRGNIGAELSALTELGYHVVLAGALPAMERTVVGAKPFVAGVALRASNLWRVEPALPPADLAELFATSVVVRFAGLDDVRSADFARRLEDVLRGGAPATAIVDGENGADLAAVVEALAALRFTAEGRPVALAGTGQLAGILAQRLAREAAATAHLPGGAVSAAGPVSNRGPVLAVVGSASPAARRQVEHLLAEGFEIVAIDAGEEGSGRDLQAAAHLRTALTGGRCIALTVGDSPGDPERSADIVARLAFLACEGQQGVRADLILTGGETAREILDALGISSLIPRAAVQYGAVLSEADDGRLVATKPGSFGDPHVLAQLYGAIKSHPSSPRAGLPAHQPPRTIREKRRSA